jgi:tetratricopeptide (TPR) repeat protein
MKRISLMMIALSVAMLLIVTSMSAQSNSGQAAPGQNPPAASQGTTPQQGGAAQQGAAQGQGAAGQATPGQAAPGQAAPAEKHPPQAKSQDEFKAYNDAYAVADPAGLEKAATDFAAKYPDSELRVLLFRKAMLEYQNANNADKMLDMGRKVLAIDPDDPQALIGVAEVLSERSRQTDLDYNEKTAEAVKDASHALETIETDMMVAPNVPPDRVKAAKDYLRSSAYAVMGNISLAKQNYPEAEQNLKKAIELGGAMQPDPVNYLRLAVALDKQNKYPDALTAVNKAVELAPENTQVGNLARQEQGRLKQLSSGSTPAATSAAPTSPQPEPVKPH